MLKFKRVSSAMVFLLVLIFILTSCTNPIVKSSQEKLPNSSLNLFIDLSDLQVLADQNEEVAEKLSRVSKVTLIISTENGEILQTKVTDLSNLEVNVEVSNQDIYVADVILKDDEGNELFFGRRIFSLDSEYEGYISINVDSIVEENKMDLLNSTVPVPQISKIEYTTLPLKVNDNENLRVTLSESTRKNVKRVYYVEAFAMRSYGEFKIAQGYITIDANQITGVGNFSVKFNTPGEIYTKVKVYDTSGKLLVQRQGLYADRIDFSLPTPTISSIRYTTLPLYVNENENLEVVLEEKSLTSVNRTYYLEVYAVRSNGEWKIAEGYLTIPSGRSTATKNFTVKFNSPGSIYTKVKVYDGNDGRFLTQRQGTYPDSIQSQVTSQPSGTVPYYNQYENYAYPGSTCNLTSVAMMLDYFGITKPGINTGRWRRTPDYLISRFGGPIYDASGLAWAFNTIAKEKGSNVRMYTKFGTVADMRAELAKGRPIIVQGWYTRSGHVLVVISFDGTYYTCNDPAGTWNEYKYGGYINRMGKYVKYHRSNFEKASIDDGDGLILFHYFR